MKFPVDFFHHCTRQWGFIGVFTLHQQKKWVYWGILKLKFYLINVLAFFWGP